MPDFAAFRAASVAGRKTAWGRPVGRRSVGLAPVPGPEAERRLWGGGDFRFLARLGADPPLAEAGGGGVQRGCGAGRAPGSVPSDRKPGTGGVPRGSNRPALVAIRLSYRLPGRFRFRRRAESHPVDLGRQGLHLRGPGGLALPGAGKRQASLEREDPPEVRRSQGLLRRRLLPSGGGRPAVPQRRRTGAGGAGGVRRPHRASSVDRH